MPLPILRNVFSPTVVDKAGLWRYVRSVTLLAWIVAICVDIVDRIASSTGWLVILREEALTTFSVLVIAIPIARSMGQAHLNLHRARQEADRLGRTDPLTGLANRRAFYEAAERLAGGGLALVIADIDRFKRINDQNGHAAGDDVLKAVAALMQAELGDLGLVARIGGEEFALIAADRPADEIGARLQRFRQRVAGEPLTAAGLSTHVTVSIGFAALRDCDFDALYAAADKALYVAKAAGRDRVVDYDRIAEIAPPPRPLAQAG